MPLANVKHLEEQYLVHTYGRYDLLVNRGSGAYLFDRNNKRYLDLLSGIGVNALGYNNTRMLRVLRKQIKRPLHVSNLLYHEYQGRLAERLAHISGLDRVFFSNSGTESVEGCLKFARAYGQAKGNAGSRSRVLAIEGSFHGRTFGALSATHSARYRAPFEPLMDQFAFVRFNDCKDLERQFSSDVGTVILEPIQGEGGIRPISLEFYNCARQLTHANGAVLIADEVQCGLARPGRWLACHKFASPENRDALPDLIALAKPLGGGLPLGAVLMKNEVAAAIVPGFHGSTFGGGPLACRMSLELLDILEEENILEHVREVGAYFFEQLKGLTDIPAVSEVRGEGLMLALELKFSGQGLVKRLLEAGFITNCTNQTVLRFLPPLIIRRKQIDQFVRTLRPMLEALGAP